jgi:hypothetical protein
VHFGDRIITEDNRWRIVAILPSHEAAWRPRHPVAKDKNHLPSHDRVLVSNFFERWKMLFELIHTVFQGQIEQLSPVVNLLIALTDYSLGHHLILAGAQKPPLDGENDQDDASLAIMVHRLDESSDSERTAKLSPCPFARFSYITDVL